jgi:hypothetical protein
MRNKSKRLKLSPSPTHHVILPPGVLHPSRPMISRAPRRIRARALALVEALAVRQLVAAGGLVGGAPRQVAPNERISSVRSLS